MQREIVEGEETHMLNAKVIRPSMSEWGAPLVLIPKKDKTPRFCIDYRRLTLATKKDSFALPRIDECIDSLEEATVFTTMDCNAGYWQIPVADEDIPETASVCHAGVYEFLRMLETVQCAGHVPTGD